MGTRVEERMRLYCKEASGCRRKTLLQDFNEDSDSESIELCKCCDLCAAKCSRTLRTANNLSIECPSIWS